MGGMGKICTLFASIQSIDMAYLYFEFTIESVKLLEYKSPMFRYPIFLSLHPSYIMSLHYSEVLCITIIYVL